MKRFLIILVLLILYLVLGHFFHIYVPCPINYVTGLYCPGCGITRMLFSIIKLDFYQAFRYNPLIFILFFPSAILYLNFLYCQYKNKVSWYIKIPRVVWYILLVLLLVYGVVRNFVPYLQPIDL